MADLRKLKSVKIQFEETDRVPVALRGKTLECITIDPREHLKSKWTHIVGLVVKDGTDDDLFYFNDILELSKYRATFYRDVSPGFRWRLQLNTLGLLKHDVALCTFSKNDDAYLYDAWDIMKCCAVSITTSETPTPEQKEEMEEDEMYRNWAANCKPINHNQ